MVFGITLIYLIFGTLNYTEITKLSFTEEIIIKNYYLYNFSILLILVGWILIASLIRFKNNKFSAKFMSHGTILELIWTITPAVVLLAIALFF